MLNNSDIESLLRMSEKAREAINLEKAAFDASFEKMLNSVPDNQRGVIERTRADMNKAIELAKQGKADEANTIIEKIKNYGR